MKISFVAFTLVNILSLSVGLASPPSESAKPAGDVLIRSGWKEVARCFDGHEWAYILANGQNQRICKGINARGGPSEQPCEIFSGNLKSFKAFAETAKKYNDDYNQASRSGKIDDFLKAKLKDKSTPHCWDAAK